VNYRLPDYRLDPPESEPPPCPHHGLDPSCDCEPDLDPPDEWCERDSDPPDPEPRALNAAEREDARMCPETTCARCGRAIGYDEDGLAIGHDENDWPDDGERCPTCLEIAKELDEEDDDDPPATLPTGEERTT